MKHYKVLFCDLDGTLIDTLSGETFPKGIWDMKLKFDVLDAINKLKPEYIFIVSNQGGIEKGFVTVEAIESKIDYVCSILEEWLKENQGFKYCKGCYCGLNDKTCEYRKPNTGLLSLCLKNYINERVISRNDCLMIGDASGLEGQWSDTDKKTAENFGIDYLDVNEFVKLYNE